jgi:hypothetical protein
MKHKAIMVAVAAVTTLGLVAATGCEDDEGDAEGLASSLEQFSNALNGTDDIVQASGDVKNDLKENCDELADGVDDNDGIEEFCEDLDEAIDDDDQAAYTAVTGQFPAIETHVRNQIAEDIGQATDDDDDGPLSGGDEGDDDGNDEGADDGADGDDSDDPDSDGDGESDDDEDDNPLTQ